MTLQYRHEWHEVPHAVGVWYWGALAPLLGSHLSLLAVGSDPYEESFRSTIIGTRQNLPLLRCESTGYGDDAEHRYWVWSSDQTMDDLGR